MKTFRQRSISKVVLLMLGLATAFVLFLSRAIPDNKESASTAVGPAAAAMACVVSDGGMGAVRPLPPSVPPPARSCRDTVGDDGYGPAWMVGPVITEC